MLCVTIYLGVAGWSRVRSEFARDTQFEQWCASQPIVLAFRCGRRSGAEGGEADDARHRLRQLLAPHDELVNVHGGAPWQYYRYDVAVRTVADDVVAVHIVAAIPQRGRWTARRDAGELVRRLMAMPEAAVEEVWMHGQLHPSEARSASRDHRSWLGRRSADGDLEITPMIGRRPQWIEEWIEAE